MPWELEIHHIDVGQGDSTLFVVRRNGEIKRSALIDGGVKDKKKETVHNYIKTIARLDRLDVMVATHYDRDHFGGLTGLLAKNDNTYDEVNIFDQGVSKGLDIKGRQRRHDGTAVVTVTEERGDPDYENYKTAIKKGEDRRSRKRITEKVYFTNEDLEKSPYTKQLKNQGYLEDKWLVGKEILWTDENGNPNPILYGGAGVPAPGALGGPPAITCIAANMYILRTGEIVEGAEGSGSTDPKNDKSLAFLIRFNNLKYYIGGDLTSKQEDDGLGDYLGRVHAMKTSHHGSGHSSSEKFIQKLQPSAAFISCGTNNSFGNNLSGYPKGHPQQTVLKYLKECSKLQRYYLTEDRHDEDFCRRINNGVGPLPAAYTQKAIVAGAWGPALAEDWGVPPSPCGDTWPDDGAEKLYGNIVLKISESQSRKTAVEFNVVIDTPTVRGKIYTHTCD